MQFKIYKFEIAESLENDSRYKLSHSITFFLLQSCVISKEIFFAVQNKTK